MDNMISGIIGSVIFAAFVAGLAESISELPFIIIVGIVIIMMLVDLKQSIKEGLAEEKAKREKA